MSDYPAITTIEEIESKGEWVSARTARSTFGLGADLLSLWRLRGCPQVRSNKIKARQITVFVLEKGGGVRRIWFYDRETLAGIAKGFEGRSRKGPGPFGGDSRQTRHRKSVEMQRKWAERERFTDGHCREWVSRQLALAQLEISNPALRLWRRIGCPYLEGRRMLTRSCNTPFGNKAAYYLQDELDEIVRAQGRAPASDAMLVSLDEAARLTGVHPRTIERFRQRGKLAIEKRRRPRKDGRLYQQTFLRREEVEALKARRPTQVPPGELTVRQAAKRLRVTAQAVRNWFGYCSYLGYPLPNRIEHLCVSRRGVQPVTLVSETDVEAIAAALADGPPIHRDAKGRWLPLQRAARVFGASVMAIHHLRRQKKVEAKQIKARDRWGHGGRRWVYLESSLAAFFNSWGEAGSRTEAAASVRPADTSPAVEEPALPTWEDATATLYWGEVPIRRFVSNPARNQRDLVEAFHRVNWVRTIPDPFHDSRKLNITIYQLNKSLVPRLIRFRGDGTGEGAMWEPTTSA